MTIKEIKGTARENLLPYLGISVIFTLFSSLLEYIITFLASLPITGTGIGAFIMYELAFFIRTLLVCIIQVGLCRYYLKLSTHAKPSLSDLFYGFAHGPDRIIKVAFVITTIEALCNLPYAVYSAFIVSELTYETLLYTSLLSLASELLVFLFTVPFTMSFFILVDMPELSTFKTIKMSFWLMKKRYFSYIWLNLSYFPLYLVATISFGIGWFWLTPYINASRAEFYLDAITRKESHS